MMAAFMECHHTFFDNGNRRLRDLEIDVRTSKEVVQTRKTHTDKELVLKCCLYKIENMEFKKENLEDLIMEQAEYEKKLSEAIEKCSNAETSNKGPLQMTSDNHSNEIDESIKVYFFRKRNKI